MIILLLASDKVVNSVGGLRHKEASSVDFSFARIGHFPPGTHFQEKKLQY